MTFAERHGLSKRGLTVHFVTMIAIIGALVLVKRAVEILGEDYLPAEYYLQYDKIETYNWAYPAGTESISVLSYYEVKKNNLHVEWDDELRCAQFDQNWESYGVQNWPAVKNKADHRVVPVVWKYRIPLPDEDVSCKIVSHITITLPSGRHKTTIFESNEFIIAPKLPRHIHQKLCEAKTDNLYYCIE